MTLISNTCITGTHPLPWRLSKEAINTIDERVRNIIYPHGIPGVADGQNSFFKDMGRVWRTADRLVALLAVLPTVLRDYIPPVRAGIRKLIWGLKILEGRCISGVDAYHLKCEPGYH